FPRINTAVMPIGKHRLDAIVAHRLYRDYPHQALAGLQGFLAGRMTAHFSRWRTNTQELERQRKTRAIVKCHFEHTRLRMNDQIGRQGVIGSLAGISHLVLFLKQASQNKHEEIYEYENNKP